MLGYWPLVKAQRKTTGKRLLLLSIGGGEGIQDCFDLCDPRIMEVWLQNHSSPDCSLVGSRFWPNIGKSVPKDSLSDYATASNLFASLFLIQVQPALRLLRAQGLRPFVLSFVGRSNSVPTRTVTPKEAPFEGCRLCVRVRIILLSPCEPASTKIPCTAQR